MPRAAEPSCRAVTPKHPGERLLLPKLPTLSISGASSTALCKETCPFCPPNPQHHPKKGSPRPPSHGCPARELSALQHHHSTLPTAVVSLHLTSQVNFLVLPCSHTGDVPEPHPLVPSEGRGGKLERAESREASDEFRTEGQSPPEEQPPRQANPCRGSGLGKSHLNLQFHLVWREWKK